jgi:hypothetical protein
VRCFKFQVCGTRIGRPGGRWERGDRAPQSLLAGSGLLARLVGQWFALNKFEVIRHWPARLGRKLPGPPEQWAWPKSDRSAGSSGPGSWLEGLGMCVICTLYVFVFFLNWGCTADLLTNQTVLDPKVHCHTSRAPQVGIEPTLHTCTLISSSSYVHAHTCTYAHAGSLM